jgi:Tfp pilus assembly protein PilX
MMPACFKQAGMVLLLSLAMLAGLSLLAVMAANSMLQQQQMAANHSDGELARISAITAVGMGEQYILGLQEDARSVNCQSNCFAGPLNTVILDPGSIPQYPETLDDDWWLSWGHPPDSTPFDSGSPGNNGFNWALPGRQVPVFIIEELNYKPSDSFPISAEGGQHTTPNSEAVPAIQGVAYYRILGRGTGIANSSTHVAESILARPWRVTTAGSESLPLDCRTFRPRYDCGRMVYRERR